LVQNNTAGEESSFAKLGTFLVWRLQRKPGLANESAIGFIFATALAIGAAVIPNEDLAESPFGELGKLSVVGFLCGTAAVLVVIRLDLFAPRSTVT
jgi:ABC-type Mn2+/Zn2+ transport system permease subunit